MGVQVLINFDNPSDTFRPGEVITGHVSINSSQNVIVNKGLILSFHGFGSVCWREARSESIQQIQSRYFEESNGPCSPFHRQTHDDYEHHRQLNYDDGYSSRHHPCQEDCDPHDSHYYDPGYNDSSTHNFVREYRNEETYLFYQKLLPINLSQSKDESSSSGTSEFPASHYHEVPFAFQLPRSLPSSCRLSYGSINYRAKASIKVKRTHLVLPTAEVTKAARREFNILGALDLEHVSDALRPLQLNKERYFGGILCLCCCSSGGNGGFRMNMRLTRTGYVPGESVMFHLNFRNDTRITVKKMKADLTQVITFVTFGKERKEKQTINRLSYKSRILSGSSGTGSDQLAIPPAAYLTDLGGSRIILVQYKLSVTAKASLCRKVALEVPITIGTMPDRSSFHH